MISQKNDFVTYRHYSVYSKIKKFSQGEKSVAFSQQVFFFFSSKYIKPVKSACNSIMLRANPSPLEQTLSKNSPQRSNECFTRRENPRNRVAMFSQCR